jgi:hypothetical protein
VELTNPMDSENWIADWYVSFNVISEIGLPIGTSYLETRIEVKLPNIGKIRDMAF